MFNKSINFIRLNRDFLNFSNQSFQIWWLKVWTFEKIQNFSSISLKLCLLGPKHIGTWGVNTTTNTLLQL